MTSHQSSVLFCKYFVWESLSDMIPAICMFFQINVKQYLDAGGMKILVDLVVLSHLHVNKATVPFQVISKK